MVLSLEADNVSPAQEYYASICKQIHEAWDRFSKDRQMMHEKYDDWMRRDHEIKVRHAQFVLETADLERTRMMLMRTLATISEKTPIAGLVVGGN